jgi:FG-GAP-like repeat
MDAPVFSQLGDVPPSGFYFNDSFTGAGVVNPNWIASSSATAGQAVLTARADAAKPTGGIAGIGAVGTDAVGNGALRLTSAAGDQSAFVLYNEKFDATKGVNITFDLFAYGGTPFADGEQPGDGISFFLVDGDTTTAITPGGFGGSLGYATKSTNQDGVVNAPGLTNAYLGVGFDEFGNFSNPDDIGAASGGPGRTIDSIAVRGSGNGTTGYNYLGGSGSLTAQGGIDTPGVTTRATARRTVEIDVDALGVVDVSIDLNNDGDFDDTNEQFNNVATGTGTRPTNYKFGFAASTGGSTNIHEIRNLAIAPSKSSDSGVLTTPNAITFGEFGTGLTYVENAAPGAVSQSLTIEGNPTNITSATVKITNNFAATQDRLTIGGAPVTTTSGTFAGTPITWAYDAAGGTLTLTGAATAAQYEAALRQVTYANSSDAPTTGDRTIRYTLLNATTPITVRDALVKINAVDDLPTNITLSSTAVPVGVAGGVVGNFIITDPDGVGDAGSYTFTQPADTRFEIVGTAATGFQLKLKPGVSIAAGTAPITGLAINLTDAGAPGTGVFTKNFDITPGQRRGEVFWRNPNGLEVFWYLDNARLVNAAVINSPLDLSAGWVLKGTADMDGDGIKDQVYNNGAQVRYLPFTETNGQSTGVKPVVTPTFASTKFGAANGQAATIAPGWELVAVENVAGTAQADLIFQNRAADRLVYWTTGANGQIVDGGFFTSATAPTGQGTGAPNTWNVQTVADFTGDGKVDVLWRNTQGVTVLWNLDGTVVNLAGSKVLPSMPTTFAFAGTGDFNGDGIKDVVWRDNAANITRFWTFNNTGSATQTADNSAIVANSGFQIQAIADMNGDGRSDILWRDSVTDRSVLWNIDLGATPGATFQISAVKTGSGYITDNRTDLANTTPFVNGDRSWKIETANGIPLVTTA